jgi:hypothetical protein
VTHEAKLPLSSLHSNVRPAAGVALSLPEKVKDAVVFVVGETGWPVIEVSGAVVSRIVHVYVAAEPSTLPAASSARTRKVCEPGTRPE